MPHAGWKRGWVVAVGIELGGTDIKGAIVSDAASSLMLDPIVASAERNTLTGMFEHTREVVQVRAIAFDPSRPGTLRNGIVTSNPDDRCKRALLSHRVPTTSLFR